MSAVTTGPALEGEVVEGRPAPRTWLRGEQVQVLDVRVQAPAAERRAVPRAVSGTTAQDRVVVVGSVVAGASLAWLLCFRLLPWGTPLAFVLVATLLTVVVVAVATAMVTPGPAVADKVASTVVTAGALVVAVAFGSTLVFTFVRAWPALWHVNLLTQDMAVAGPRDPLTVGGVLHAIVGSLIQIGIASAITVPLALGTAVFMTEIGGPYARVVRTVVEAMTALPSVVAGLFTYTVFVLLLGVPRSGFAASLAITVMMLPIVARAADVVLRVVPSGLREAGLALGSSRWRVVWHVVLPTARPGLATALILGIARGIGETSPVLLTSGASQFLVADPFHTVMNSLPLFVFSTVRSGEPVYIQRGFAAAAVLLTLVLLLFVTTRFLARRKGGSR
ncbi:MAG: phosphate ABC transporter permease PstA [Promicromonosporaceae bacterium]|nr:phosphate ABC transporter permease PstA [Promicromonosporaceae bacterium]